jgi:hypothetical protein
MHEFSDLSASPARAAMTIASIGSCIDASYACRETCASTAEACLLAVNAQDLTQCIQLCLDCAEVCLATGDGLAKLAGLEPRLAKAQILACAAACRACAEVCEAHMHDNDHCRIAALSARACEQVCLQTVGLYPAL